MSLKNVVMVGVKLVVLWVLFFILISIGGAIFRPQIPPAPPEQMAWVLPGLFLLVIVDTLMVSLIIWLSRWRGWRLMLATAFSLYGVMTFMSQIETVWFAPALGILYDWLPGFFLQTLPLAVVFVPLAVVVWGKGKRVSSTDSDNQRLVMPAQEWVWKLAVLAVVYVVLYFGFGFFIAWQNPSLRNLYGGGSNPEVFSPLRLVPFQLFRGVLWTLFALPIIRMTRGGVWTVAVVVGLLYALPMNMFHAIPNGLMPDPSVRLSHFIETASSNFVFGLVVTWLLLWRPHRFVHQS